jgi:hypothetical protein
MVSHSTQTKTQRETLDGGWLARELTDRGVLLLSEVAD